MERDNDSLLKDEYLFLQNAYEEFDRKALLIKGWSVTVSLGGIVVGYQEESIGILLLAALASMIFWILEAMWKHFQYCNSVRIKRLEAYFRGELDALVPFQAYTTWFETFRASKGWIPEVGSNMLLGPVLFPHAPAVLLVFILVVIDESGVEILCG